MLNHIVTMDRMAVIDGRLQLRDWTDRDGNKRRSAEIVADNVHFGNSRPQNRAAPRDYAAAAYPGGVEEIDDCGELPF